MRKVTDYSSLKGKTTESTSGVCACPCDCSCDCGPCQCIELNSPVYAPEVDVARVRQEYVLEQ